MDGRRKRREEVEKRGGEEVEGTRNRVGGEG